MNIKTGKTALNATSGVDPRFKALLFLSEEEREQKYSHVIAGSASLKVGQNQSFLLILLLVKMFIVMTFQVVNAV